jgi:hypothetical protein
MNELMMIENHILYEMKCQEKRKEGKEEEENE